MEQEIFEALQEKLTSAEILEYIARNTDDASSQSGEVCRKLFEQCWQEYGEVERSLRELLAAEDSDEAQDLLAQALLDIHSETASSGHRNGHSVICWMTSSCKARFYMRQAWKNEMVALPRRAQVESRPTICHHESCDSPSPTLPIFASRK